MKRFPIILMLSLLVTSGCIVIEDEPVVTLNPTVDFQAYLNNSEIVTLSTIRANPAFVFAGNIQAIYVYEGSVELMNWKSGEIIATESITGEGLASIVEVTTSDQQYENLLIVASGNVVCYADKESDGNRSNDIIVNSSEFRISSYVSDFINQEIEPELTLDPAVEYQTHIREGALYATATVRANPAYQQDGTLPAWFQYDGVIQLYDQSSGSLLKSGSIEGDGTLIIVNIFADTSGIDGMIAISSGEVHAYADLSGNGPSADDSRITSAAFYEVLTIDFAED